jgi:hypothetical protein
MPIKIAQYQFFDIPMQMHEIPSFMANVLNEIKENKELYRDVDELYTLFHNETHRYSGIQFGHIDGHLSLSAYGTKEIKAVEEWWKIYSKQHKYTPTNILTGTEDYELELLDYFVKYKVELFLTNKEKKYDKHSETDFEMDMEQYLVSNYFPFFNHIGYRHDRNRHNLYAVIISINKKGKQRIFRGKQRDAYDIIFKSNIKLPRIFAMGQSTALGYGKVYRR